MPDGVSVQLYTVRQALAADVEQTLGRLAEIGLTMVEPFALLDFADRLATGLAATGLTAPTTHVDVLGGDREATFAAAQALGIQTLIQPSSARGRWRRRSDIEALAAGLSAAAEEAATFGLRVGYHNHEFELQAQIEGRSGLEVLTDALDQAVLLEVDTYWAHAGGADVPALLHTLGDRVVALHVKDGDGSLDPARQVAVGAGAIPVEDILAAAPDALRVIELDESPGDPFDAVAASHAYLTRPGATLDR